MEESDYLDGIYSSVKTNYWFCYRDNRGNQKEVVRQSERKITQAVKNLNLLRATIYRTRGYWTVLGADLTQTWDYRPQY